MELNHNSFQIRDLTNRILSGWIWVILLGGLGAIVGFIVSLILHPRYEAAASILINIDYGRVAPLELVVEDRVLDRVWHLIVSDETYIQTVEKLNTTQGDSNVWGSVEALRDHTRLDARLSEWELFGIHSNPEIAVVIANAWQDIALKRLNEAMEHAWKAQTIQGVTFDVACVQMLIVEELDNILSCVAYGPEVNPETLVALREEITASHGILPIISYEPFKTAILPEHPVLWPRGLLVFSGGMIGFMLGLILCFIPRGIKKTSLHEHNNSQSISGTPHP